MSTVGVPRCADVSSGTIHGQRLQAIKAANSSGGKVVP